MDDQGNVSMDSFFRKGSFAAVASQVLWLAAFLDGIAACAVGVTSPSTASAFVLPDGCAAGLSEFSSLYISGFVSIVSCMVQACSAALAAWVLGHGNTRVDRLPASSRRWCRLLVFGGVFFCGVSFAGVVAVADFFVVVRLGKFACLGRSVRFVLVAADVLAALVAVAVFLAGSYISFYCR
ncbi:hypothetical protein ACP70R_021862 [Stipagrostis hirtigluma subsp. patula]